MGGAYTMTMSCTVYKYLNWISNNHTTKLSLVCTYISVNNLSYLVVLVLSIIVLIRVLSQVIFKYYSRALNSHALCVRHTHFTQNSRSHALCLHTHAYQVKCRCRRVHEGVSQFDNIYA